MNKKKIIYSEFNEPPSGFTREEYWTNFYVAMAELMGYENKWIARGFRATDKGVLQGGVIVNGFEDLCICFKSDSKIEFFVENGRLKLRSENDHGASFFEVKRITTIGETMAGMSALKAQALHNLLFTVEAYSVAPTLDYDALLKVLS